EARERFDRIAFEPRLRVEPPELEARVGCAGGRGIEPQRVLEAFLGPRRERRLHELVGGAVLVLVAGAALLANELEHARARVAANADRDASFSFSVAEHPDHAGRRAQELREFRSGAGVAPRLGAVRT